MTEEQQLVAKPQPPKPQQSTLGLPVGDDVVGFILENLGITAVYLVSTKVRDEDTPRSFPARVLRGMMASAVSVDMTLAIQHVISRYVFNKVPYFNGSFTSNRPPITLEEFVRDRFFLFLPFNLLASLTATGFMSLIPEDEKEKAKSLKSTFLGFCFRLILYRVVLDGLFYYFHYLLHTKRFYQFHRQHHEHKKTHLPTNYHFHPIDLYFEGFAPGFLSLIFWSIVHGVTNIDLLNILPPEANWFMTMSLWHEAGLHTGKQCPGMITAVPPLSLLYNRLFPNVIDRDNVLFHERHHNLVTANFGATTWIDRLMGTIDMRTVTEKQDALDRERS